jgi:hypothetical protein
MMNEIYTMYTLRMIIMGIVLFSAAHYGALFFNFNLAEYMNLVFFRIFSKRAPIDKILYAIFAICAVIVAVDRDTWLPFLGNSVLPSAVVPLKTNIGDTTVKVQVQPNAKVVFWAAKPSKEGNKPEVSEAYDDYSNSGVVNANDQGEAILTFNKGTEYVVPSGRQLESHVHYREFRDKIGMVGPVQSVYV